MGRRRRSSPKTTGPALEGLLEAIAPEDAGDIGLARIQRAWPGAVGSAIAAAGAPVALVDGVLHVACEDATWAHELQLLEATLLDRLHAAGMADITAIRSRAGASDGRPTGPGNRFRR